LPVFFDPAAHQVIQSFAKHFQPLGALREQPVRTAHFQEARRVSHPVAGSMQAQTNRALHPLCRVVEALLPFRENSTRLSERRAAQTSSSKRRDCSILDRTEFCMRS